MRLTMDCIRLPILAALCVCCDGAALCGKKGACSNAVDLNQSRPVLTGVGNATQPHTNADGTCKYGHVAVGEQCRPRWQCGLTFYTCTCIDEKTAQDRVGSDTNLKLIGGIGFIVVGALVIVAIIFLEQNRRAQQAKTAQVRPQELTGVCVSPSDAPAVKAQPRVQPFKVDGMGLLCFGLLAAVMLGGVIILFVALNEDDERYFNECDA